MAATEMEDMSSAGASCTGFARIRRTGLLVAMMLQVPLQRRFDYRRTPR